MDLAPTIPVLPSATVRAWPKCEEGGRASYTPPARALTTRYQMDAHIAGYSVPSVERRLSREAVERVGVTMALVLFDIDAPDHSASDEWWASERAKVFDLFETHPGGFVYRTRGGYRIVYVTRPIYLRAADDVIAWRCLYVAWCAYLERLFSVVADRACKDWQRLYRLPHATRDEGGQPENRETLGDANNIGAWSCDLTAADMAAAEESERPAHKATVRASNRTSSYAGRGRLVQAFECRGWLGDEIEAGKYAARCPWESSHSKGESFDGSTVIYEASAGRDLGWFHCSHAHCTSRTLEDAIAMFDDDEMGNQRKVERTDAPPMDYAPPLTEEDAPPATNQHAEISAPSQRRASPLARLQRLGTTITDQTIALRQEPTPTGVAELDGMLDGGLFVDEVAQVGAKPGAGKTSLVLGTAYAAATSQRPRPVLYVSGEMSPPELEARIITRRAPDVLGRAASWRDVLRGRLTARERAQCLDGSLPIDVLRMAPSDSALVTIRDTAAAIADRDGRSPYVIVDFVQALALGSERELRRIVGEIAYGLRYSVAESLHAPVMLVSSIARGFYGAGKESKSIAESENAGDFLSSGKEAGELEFCASVVMYLQPMGAADGAGWSPGRIAISKARMGLTGFVPIKFHGLSGRFEGDVAGSPTRLTEDERAIVAAVSEAGHLSRDEIREAVGKGKQWTLATIRRLEALHVLRARFDKHLELVPAMPDPGAET